MSRQRAEPPVDPVGRASSVPNYKGSFLIDPYSSPDRQEYRVCAETWSEDSFKALRRELEFPINQSLRELSGSGRYALLREQLERSCIGHQAANRLIISIQIYDRKIDSGFFVADLNSIMIRFITFTPGDAVFRCEPIVRESFRIELGISYFADNYVTVLSHSRGEYIKLFAHADNFDYIPLDNTRSDTERVAVLREDSPAQGDQGDPALATRLKKTVEYIDNFRNNIKDEIERNLNDYLSTQDPSTAKEKTDISLYINAILDRLGFVIVYQGKQCNLNVTAGKKDEKGRFRLTPITTRVHLTSPAKLSELLPIHLADPILLESSNLPSFPHSTTKWRDQVSQTADPSQTAQNIKR